jgi:uncharacterized protein (DUF934 family)
MPDLLQFMLQGGFDSFEVSDRYDPELWLRSLKRMSVTYQHNLADRRTAHAASSVWSIRHQPQPPPIDQKKIG